MVLCAGLGVLVGHYAPEVPDGLNRATIAQISLPVAILIWLMVFPMLVQIDLLSLRNVRRNLVPLAVTSGINYFIQPFTMYALALLFFKVIFRSVIGSRERQDQYVAGSVILGGSPCTAMVFVWSFLVQGDPAYTLVQVAVNDILIFVFYIPTLMLLLRVTNITVPWDTAFLSVALFMLVPGLVAAAARWYAARYRDSSWLDALVHRLKPVTVVALLATLFLIFTFQGQQMTNHPVDVLLIAVPLLLQSLAVFGLAYGVMAYLRVPFVFAAPGALIATSNFFELAVAVAMSLFGAESGATLATVVGVLEEVPVMLALVWLCNRTRHWFPDPAALEAYLATTLAHQTGKDIPASRQQVLLALATAISRRLQDKQQADVLFLCVHNSRRSQLSEAWFLLAVERRGLKSIRVFSAGSESTRIDNHTLGALRRAGFVVQRSGWSRLWPVRNPRYRCSWLLPSGRCAAVPAMFSKLTTDASIPTTGCITVAVCAPSIPDGAEDALGDASCPYLPGAEKRFSVPHVDPGKFNSAPGHAADAAYDSVCAQICREMFFVAQHIEAETVKAAGEQISIV